MIGTIIGATYPVDVFVNMQKEIKHKGGELILLNKSFRSHQPLLNAMDEFLKPIYENANQAKDLFAIPYSELIADREEYVGPVNSPYIECEIGLAEDSDEARRIMATSLANKLIQMKNEKEIEAWSEVALLFRASSGFQYYEDAFNIANIPFVTIAGSGFYDRPEIRDILNLLSAISNPYDDNALLGLLRSPAFGLSEEMIYSLRIDNNVIRSIYAAIKEITGPQDSLNKNIRWVKETIQTFEKLVNHMSVSDLLYRIINYTNYKSILLNNDFRLIRNLEKLLEDAHTSGANKVSDFIEYINYSKEKGVHEGEATVEAKNRVQLMTIHKSKGLEFPVVILADAGRQINSNRSPLVYQSEYGPIYKLGKDKNNIVEYRFIHQQNKQKEENESNRLLYVACTRAINKLLISGHCTKNSPRGFIKKLGIEKNQEGSIDFYRELDKTTLSLYEQVNNNQYQETINKQLSNHSESVAFLCKALDQEKMSDQSDLINLFELEASSRKSYNNPLLAKEFGSLVHKALQLWIFPEDQKFDEFINNNLELINVIDQEQKQKIIQQIKKLLITFQGTMLYQDIQSADERYHELPFAVSTIGNGIIDLLYEKNGKLYIVDFKTDHIKDDQELHTRNEEYSKQLLRYKNAIKIITKRIPSCRICYLNYKGTVNLIDLDSIPENFEDIISIEKPIEGYELELPNGDILMAEFGFEKNKIAVFLKEQEEDKIVFSASGWRTFYLDEIDLKTIITDIDEGKTKL